MISFHTQKIVFETRRYSLNLFFSQEEKMPMNHRRFVVLSLRLQPRPSKKYKTGSIVFVLKADHVIDISYSCFLLTLVT